MRCRSRLLAPRPGTDAPSAARPRRKRAVAGLAAALALTLLAAGCHSGSSGPQSAGDGPNGSGPAQGGSGGSTSVASPPAGVPASLGRFYTQRIAWHECGGADELGSVNLIGLQCGSIAVPLDYAHPGRRTIRIAVVAHRATGSRIGSLVVNPGGPGASGVDFVPSLLKDLPSVIRERFDVVGFDPRGVGRSAPVRCLDDRGLDTFLGQDPNPQTAAGVAHLVAQDRAFAAACQQHSGWELPYIGTVDAARDIDILRSALGQRRLSYLGKSYGTLLGATYADLFPKRVRAFVLDGAVDPALPTATVYHQQAVGFETDLRDFLADCARRSDCPLGSDPATAARTLDGLLASIANRPLPAPRAGHSPLTAGYATTGIVATLYSPKLWQYLRLGLGEALRGDGSVLMAIADAYDGRSSRGHYTNLMTAFFAITCADGPTRASVATAQAAARQWAADAPHFGPGEAWGLVQCDAWPAPPTARRHALRAAGAPPILVVGTTRDPATPYAWAQGLAKQLRSGRLLGFNGDGHTAYAEGRSACVDDAVNAYLVSLRLPPRGTVCS